MAARLPGWLECGEDLAVHGSEIAEDSARERVRRLNGRVVLTMSTQTGNPSTSTASVTDSPVVLTSRFEERTGHG